MAHPRGFGTGIFTGSSEGRRLISIWKALDLLELYDAGSRKRQYAARIVADMHGDLSRPLRLHREVDGGGGCGGGEGLQDEGSDGENAGSLATAGQ